MHGVISRIHALLQEKPLAFDTSDEKHPTSFLPYFFLELLLGAEIRPVIDSILASWRIPFTDDYKEKEILVESNTILATHR